MASTFSLPEDLERYYSHYRAWMHPRETTTSIRERFLNYLFALADPSCPFHLHVERDSPPSFGLIYDVLCPSGVDSKSGWKAEMFRWNGDRGLLQVRGSQLKCRLKLPSGEKAKQISELRQKLETETLLGVHRLAEQPKQAAIERMREANLAIGAKAKLAEEYAQKPEELRARLWTDPSIGDWANKFWERNREFHLAGAKATGQVLIEETLEWLLALMRLRNADRLTMICHFARSYQEHEAIIAAVEAKEKKGSADRIERLVREHLESAESDFQRAREARRALDS